MNKQEFIDHIVTTQEWLRRFLASLCCGDMFLVDELAQETYIKAYLSIDKFKDDKKFKAWLIKIAYNTYISHVRKIKPIVDIEEIRTIESEKQADTNFQYEDLYSALRSLPSMERASIILYYMEGYSSKEIAYLLQTKDQNVRQALSRGRERLRILLKHG